MLREKRNTAFAAAWLLLLACLHPGAVGAQEAAVLDGVYPHTVSPGEQVEMALRGAGFRGLGKLTGVLITGQQVGAWDAGVVSDELIVARMVIPENTAARETEMTFLFGNVALDAYLNVVPAGGRDALPAIRAFKPREGRPDGELTLFFEGDDLSALGDVGGVVIADTDVPVYDYRVDSDESMFLTLYLPPDTPVGQTSLIIFFENGRFAGPFYVEKPEGIEPPAPALHAVEPAEGFAGTEIELVLYGEGFSDLGDLHFVDLAGIDAPIVDYVVESDEGMVVVVYLPPDLPAGDTGIVFFFDNRNLEAPFTVLREEGAQPAAPRVAALDPREGEVDRDVELTLHGENLLELGELYEVTVGGMPVPILHAEPEAEDRWLVAIYLPPEVPRGEQSILLRFENLDVDAPFFVIGPKEPPPQPPGGAPRITRIDPREGEADTDLDLVLEGEHLLGLGDLVDVRLAGSELPVRYAESRSDARWAIGVTLPRGVREGEHTIRFVFENAEFEDSFFVRATPDGGGIPPGAVAAAGAAAGAAALGAGGLAIRQARSRRRTRTKAKATPTVTFEPAVDPGEQRVELSEPSLTMDVELRFEVTMDGGDPRFEVDRRSIVDKG